MTSLTPVRTGLGEASSAGPVLSVTRATVGYRQHPVVLDVDLDVAPGEAVALMGSNGSGKTTLVRGVLGLAEILQGSIQVLGSPAGSGSTASRVGYVPQRHTLSGSVPSTAAEVVGTGLLATRGFWRPPGRAARTAIGRALDEVGLPESGRDLVSEMSGGQQRRVLIARALVSDPHLLLLDEPTAGVDRASTASLVETLKVVKAAGRALVIVTHDLAELGSVPNRAVTISDGRVLSDLACTCDPATGCCVVVDGR